MRKSPLLFLLLAVPAILCGCAVKGKPATPSVRTVKTVRVEEVGAGLVSSYPGVVKEASSINVAFKTAGQIESVNVKEGDYVRVGQLLSRLDDKDYKLGLEALQVQYDQLSDEVGRLRELFEKKSLSANDYEKAKAGLTQLGIQLRLNQNKVAYTKLYAPVSGYIKAVNFAASEMVDAGTPVFAMMDVSKVEVLVDIPVSEYRLKETFKSFTCSTPQGFSVPLSLVSVAPKADGNQLYRMTLRCSGTQSADLLPGTNVEVLIDRGDKENGVSGLTLPLAAVRYDGAQAFVWTVGNDSTLVRADVTVSATDHADKVLVSGVASGTEVICAGAATLKQGEKVRILGRQPESNVGGLL